MELIWVLWAVFGLIVGVLIGGLAERKSDIDNDIRVYVPSWSRNGRGNNRCTEPMEIDDITNVLQNIALSCTGYERRCVDAAIRIINKIQELLTEA